MRHRRLGEHGPEVSAIGLGCMGMSIAYGVADEGQAMRTLDHTLDLGVNFLDTADVYGEGANEELVGRWLRRQNRDEIVLATKFGLRRDPATGRVDAVDTSPAYVAQACDASLGRLGVTSLDLFYAHRRDPAVPVEDTVGAMAALVAAGKVRHLGLSEVSAETLRKAHAVHPISAVQLEYSLFTRDVVEGEMLSLCRELGIAVVAYSPLGRGMITGAIGSAGDLLDTDARRRWPRFAPDNFTGNLALVRAVETIAAEIGCTAAQAALAWLLAQGADIVPIPGTKQPRYLAENAAATEIELTAEQVSRLSDAVPAEAVAGERYPIQALARLGH